MRTVVPGKMSVSDPADLAAILKATAGKSGAAFSIRCIQPWFAGLAPLLRNGGGATLDLGCTPALLRQVLSQLGWQAIAERRTGFLETWFEVSPSPDSPLPAIAIHERCELRHDHCLLDGRRYTIKRGNWAFYVPELQLKILHARDGNRWCLHKSRPAAGLLETGDGAQRLGPYSLQDWRDALATSVLRRVAENHVSARRLAATGIGPATGDFVLLRTLDDGEGNASVSAGFKIANLMAYVRRRQASPADLDAAGVSIDRIRSALRQQIRGYVSDLDSVVGVYPLGAEDEVRSVEARLAAALSGKS